MTGVVFKFMRRQYYYRGESPLSFFADKTSFELTSLMFAVLKPDGTVVNCLEWMLKNLPRTQVIRIEQWVGSKWYITAEYRDQRYKGVDHPANARVGFTVDVAHDKIITSDDGGNCFVRDFRWKKKLISKFGADFVSKSFFNYKDIKK